MGFVLVVLGLDEDLLDHLRVGHLNVVSSTVNQLVDHVSVHFLTPLSDHPHRYMHQRKEMLLLFVLFVIHHQRCLEVLQAFGFELSDQIVITLLLQVLNHFMDTHLHFASLQALILIIIFKQHFNMPDLFHLLQPQVHLLLELAN